MRQRGGSSRHAQLMVLGGCLGTCQRMPTNVFCHPRTCRVLFALQERANRAWRSKKTEVSLWVATWLHSYSQLTADSVTTFNGWRDSLSRVCTLVLEYVFHHPRSLALRRTIELDDIVFCWRRFVRAGRIRRHAAALKTRLASRLRENTRNGSAERSSQRALTSRARAC